MGIAALKNVKQAKETEKIQAGIRMNKALWKKVRELALQLDMPASEYIEELVEKDMKKRNF